MSGIGVGANRRVNVIKLESTEGSIERNRKMGRLLSGYGVMGSGLVVNRPGESESVRIGSDREVDPEAARFATVTTGISTRSPG
jgi:hypothetical protein